MKWNERKRSEMIKGRSEGKIQSFTAFCEPNLQVRNKPYWLYRCQSSAPDMRAEHSDAANSLMEMFDLK